MVYHRRTVPGGAQTARDRRGRQRPAAAGRVSAGNRRLIRAPGRVSVRL